MLCRQATIVKQYVHHLVVNPLRCRCWHCPECEGMRLAGLAQMAREGRPTTFLTFTMRGDETSDHAEQARTIKWAWTNMRRLICRKYKIKHIPFLAIFEETQKGVPHLHVLARMGFVDQAWLSEQWERMTGAFKVDIRAVRSVKGVARYVSKYVSKAPKMWEGTKRYWRSLDWIKKPEAPKGDHPKSHISWWRIDCHVDHAIRLYLDRGYNYGTDGSRHALWGAEGREPPWLC